MEPENLSVTTQSHSPAYIAFAMSVCPSASYELENLWTDFHKILKPGNNNGRENLSALGRAEGVGD
jgi:hypothetical protein